MSKLTRLKASILNSNGLPGDQFINISENMALAMYGGNEPTVNGNCTNSACNNATCVDGKNDSCSNDTCHGNASNTLCNNNHCTNNGSCE